MNVRIQASRCAAPLVALMVILSGCSVYDPDLLPAAPLGGNLGSSGARATGGAGGMGGDSGNGGGGAGGTSTTGGSGGGAGVSSGGTGGVGVSGVGGGAGDVVQRPAMCGDGILSEGELCDMGIAAGSLGACPTECEPLNPCLLQVITGEGCQTECVPTPPECNDNDDCCPMGCTFDTDNDCSQRCGDGTVQASEGETCEPDHETDPCPTDCDDSDACTVDLLGGSAQTCNATCTHVNLGLAPSDGCCPEGANNNTDNDCPAECGNGIKEGAEECDSGVGCDGNCKLTVTQEQLTCLEGRLDTSVDPACEECQCLQCTQQMLDCLFDTDNTRRALCENLSNCALQANCTSVPCYCGADAAVCGGLFGPAMGPCAAEVELAAGGTNDPIVVLGRVTDPNYALGRANLLGECGAMQCPSVCP